MGTTARSRLPPRRRRGGSRAPSWCPTRAHTSSLDCGSQRARPEASSSRGWRGGGGGWARGPARPPVQASSAERTRSSAASEASAPTSSVARRARCSSCSSSPERGGSSPTASAEYGPLFLRGRAHDPVIAERADLGRRPRLEVVGHDAVAYLGDRRSHALELFL